MSQTPIAVSQPRTFDTEVLVVGAGPTGLALATALTARGIATTVVDRLAAGVNTSRAAVVHARTLEVLEDIGVTAALVDRGIKATRFTIRDRDRVLIPIGSRPAHAISVHADGLASGNRGRLARTLAGARRHGATPACARRTDSGFARCECGARRWQRVACTLRRGRRRHAQHGARVRGYSVLGRGLR